MIMADTTALENALQCYVASITDDLLLAKAQLLLEQYIAAENAFSNINASAASSYSDARGTVNKRVADNARAQADELYNELIRICKLGGVSVTETEAGMALWDISGHGQ